MSGRPRYFPLVFLSWSMLLAPGCETARGSSAPARKAAQDQPLPKNQATPPAPAEQSPLKAPASDAARAEADHPRGAPNELDHTIGDRPPTDAVRVYAKTRHVWIRSMPRSDVQWIGYLWWGGSVKVRNETPVEGAGCSKKWVAIEPRGWVCVDEEQATMDPNDRELVAIFPYRPRVDSPWPHRYAWAHAPLTKFESPPDEVTQKQRERGYEAHFQQVLAARQSGSNAAFPDYLGKLDPSLSGNPAPSLPSLPRGLQEGQNKIVGRSALSYVEQFDVENRGFLLSGDLGWIPKDRVELLDRSEFQGVELGENFHLPVAFFRGHDRPAFALDESGQFVEQPERFARHAHVQLTEQFKRVDRTTFYKVAGQDLWVSDREAVVPTPKDTTPWGAKVGQPDSTGLSRPGRSTWFETTILGGWLVAFEGTRAAYVTMISAGRGGTPVGDRDPVSTASTPTGRFAIGGKFKTATMESSSTPIVHADVPWTQNFSGPHAIHGAYWHDDFGNLKSAGCVNVSPRDGKWLFEFTEPEVPDGWHGVRYVARYGGGSTLVILHE